MAELIPVYDEEAYAITAPTWAALVDLYAKADELDTAALTAYAKERGFRPPREEDAAYWDIVKVGGFDGGYIGLAWEPPGEGAGQTWTPGSEDQE